ncbi:isopropylmalate/homocitrate/citramalate synthase [Halomonas organivorans]|uniref:Isopropylmalate/homocitrate/citramalate synthase n=1 Tax=Halomonas organivorans TaxID=257772 RepID=A0A7W5BVD2_9GAMM|nr:isopropylmalate/homocitrate/citramalate synthase [Halomonas organivorans]
MASEDVVYLLNGLGIESGIDLDKLAETGHWITQAIGRPNRSKASVALASR